jgi:hypothetical protein
LRLIPNPQKAIPRASRYGHSIFGYTKTTDTIIVAGQYAYFYKEKYFDENLENNKLTSTFKTKCIPNIAIKIIIAG